MNSRFAQLPSALRAQSITTRLAGVPALLAHPEPNWNDSAAATTPRPTVIWMHGRTVNKELDPGRYLRWIRAGFATCALDLPGHGERFIEGRQGSDSSLDVVEQMANEIDGVIAALAEPAWRGAFDTSRLALGGMSAGGMATLIRLTRPHPFRCACVESTAGDFSAMSKFAAFYTRGGRDPAGEAAHRLSPAAHLDSWRPIPLLALHSEADSWVPIDAIRSFTDALKERYAAQRFDPTMINLITWPTTGAPNEHAGFGRVASEAKDIQLRFLEAWLKPGDRA